MLFNVYGVRDVVSGSFIGVGFSETDGAFMRDGLRNFLQVRPLDELEYYKIGTFDNLEGVLTHVDKVLCSKDAYKFPEAPAKSLSKEDILALASQLQSQTAKTKK